MKEKLSAKNVISVILCSYMIIVVLVMLLNYFTVVKSIELHDTPENIELLESYKKEVDKISNESCRKNVYALINKYEKTSYDGEISLQDYYKGEIQNGGAVLNYFSKIKDACDISEEEIEKYNLKELFLSSAIQFDQIAEKYVFQYELHIKDYYLREVLSVQLFPAEYLIQRNGMLSIISSIIELERDRGAI